MIVYFCTSIGIVRHYYYIYLTAMIEERNTYNCYFFLLIICLLLSNAPYVTKKILFLGKGVTENICTSSGIIHTVHSSTV